MSNIPEWVKDQIEDKINASEIGECRNGFYELTLTREECGRFDCTLSVWVARIHSDVWDYWDRESDPTKQRDDITWREFDIYEITSK